MWIDVNERLPEKSGTYKVKNNATSVNNGRGYVYYNIESGWDIPDMIKNFYKILAWEE